MRQSICGTLSSTQNTIGNKPFCKKKKKILYSAAITAANADNIRTQCVYFNGFCCISFRIVNGDTQLRDKLLHWIRTRFYFFCTFFLSFVLHLRSYHTSYTKFQSGSTYSAKKIPSSFFFDYIFVLRLWNVMWNGGYSPRKTKWHLIYVTSFLQKCHHLWRTDKTQIVFGALFQTIQRFKITLDELHDENICHFYAFTLKRILHWHIMLFCLQSEFLCVSSALSQRYL